MYPKIKNIYLKNKSAIFEYRKLDYSEEKFSTTFEGDYDKIEFEESFFSKLATILFRNHHTLSQDKLFVSFIYLIKNILYH